MVGCVQWKLTVPSLTPGWESESCRGTREWAAGWQGHLGAGLGLAGAGGLTEWSSPRTSGKSAEPAPEATGCLKEMNGSGKNPASKWLIGFASVGPMNIHEVSLLTSAFSAPASHPSPRADRQRPTLGSDWPSCSWKCHSNPWLVA